MSKTFDFKVEMDGAADFGRQIKDFRTGLTGLSESISYTAAEMTADATRPGVPVVSGKAARSVQAYMTGSTAITQGGDNVEYYDWLEHGGPSGVHGSNFRTVDVRGRYIYPAYERIQPQIQSMMERQIQEFTDKMFR